MLLPTGTGTWDNFTKTCAFWLRERRSAQYSLRALLSVGTVKDGKVVDHNLEFRNLLRNFQHRPNEFWVRIRTIQSQPG